MNAKSATVAANRLTQNASNYVASTIEIYYGTYNKGSHGGAFNDGCATITVYNISPGYTAIGGSYTNANNTTAVYYSGE